VKKQTLCAVVLMLVFALSRWPGLMPSNFSAAYALAFCAGLYFPAVVAWVLPLATLLVTDVLLNALYYSKFPGFSWGDFIPGITPNYIGYAAFIGLGVLLRSKRSFWTLLSGSFLGAIVFYAISNTASWLTLSYAKTFMGWIQSMTVGLPGFPPTWMFLLKTLFSAGLFTALFVGSMKAVEAVEESKQEKEQAAPQPVDEPAEETEEPAAT
jgi:hypothetical protein